MMRRRRRIDGELMMIMMMMMMMTSICVGKIVLSMIAMIVTNADSHVMSMSCHPTTHLPTS